MENTAAGGGASRLGRVLARHKVLSGVVVAWVAAMVAFPTVAPGDRSTGLLGLGRDQAAQGESAFTDVAGDGTAATTSGPQATPIAAARGRASTTSRGGPGAGTAAGAGCQGGPRFPSAYARPCFGFTAGNPGATAQGVTGKTIKIVYLNLPDTPESAVFREFSERAGFASEEDYKRTRDVFLAYFNRVFQLYGRKVELVEYTLQYGDGDREQACVDAARIAEQHRPYGVWASGQINLATCLAERGIASFSAGGAYPERFLARYHPYIWTDLTECERIGHQLAEYVGKRLVHRPARWAGDPAYRSRPRKFGAWIPEDDVYKPCIEIAINRLRAERGVSVTAVHYAPVLDRIAQDAQAAAIRFKQAGVTSVLAATDYNGMTVFTHAATSQGWRPEWVLVGAGNETIDNVARLFDQSQVDGHMFGRSPYGPMSRALGPDSEPAKVHQAETGRPMPAGTEGGYHSMIVIFDLLQGAGPVLTAENMARGAAAAPTFGSPFAVLGTVGYNTRPDGAPGMDHSVQDQATEVFWDGSDRGYDGQRGVFRHTYDARFFGLGEWPAEEPPIYPDR